MQNSNSSSGRSAIKRPIIRSGSVCVLFVLGVGLDGCLSTPLQWQRITMNQTIKNEDVSFIKPGETTFWEVVSKLGPPDQISGAKEPVGGLPEFFEKVGEPGGPASGGGAGGRGGGGGRFGGGGMSGKMFQQLMKPEKARGKQIGNVARYRFLDMKRFEINFTWFLRFLLPAMSAPGVPSSSTFGSTDFGADEFQIGFDKDWVVRYTAFARDAQASSFKLSPFDLDEPEPGQLQMIAF